jgi:hypothetical protein
VRASVRAGERTGRQVGRRKERCTLPLSISFFSFAALLQTVMSQIVVIFAVSFRYGKVDERERERGSVYSKRLAKKSKNSVMP